MTELRDELLAAIPDPGPGPGVASIVRAGSPGSAAGGRVPPLPPRSPGSRLRATVTAVDERIDAWFGPYRGRPNLDAAAKIITGLGDHGFIWAVITAWRARRPGVERTRALWALAVAGIESRLVNSTLKQTVGRYRPDQTGLKVTAGGIPVRAPTSSSFPSGHTLAAFCAATTMCRPGDRTGNRLLLATASLVGLSRLHLRAHHASDVAGGAVVGMVLGLIGGRLLRLLEA